ncbi:MAG: DUF2829 domain-containing protein [Hungatella sp.]|nr:DUF2829 domain-containing protein [Hungatella sp.]
MFIHEAIKEAIDTTSTIRQKSWRECEIEFILTDPIAMCIKGKQPTFWNPTPNDLMADDWEVVE